MTAGIRSDRTNALAPFAVGGWAAAIACVPDLSTKLLLAAPAPVAIGLWWLVSDPARWIGVLFFSLLLLPPLPVALGNSGAHLAPAIAWAGLVIGVLRTREWTRWQGWLPRLVLMFFAVLLSSTALALVYSGAQIALGSAARVFLFAIAVYVFFYALAGPRRLEGDPFGVARLLFTFGLIAALFACADFYFQFPAPGGFSEQYIWVGQDVLRRAQGLFYDAGTLGNFAAFFLVMILVACFRARQEQPFSRLALAAGFIVFAAALIFSYSRASAVTVAVALCALLYVRRFPIRRLVWLTAGLGCATVAMLRLTLPNLFAYYLTRATTSFQYFGESPDRILSGRLTTWNSVIGLLAAHPLDAIAGIGYKTLPYSQYAGEGLVADNTYLSLLVETGVIGLIVFLLMNFFLLRSALRAAKSPAIRASFFGTWIFCFWCGELVQMFSGDLITYWRVLPLYFWVLGTSMREGAA